MPASSALSTGASERRLVDDRERDAVGLGADRGVGGVDHLGDHRVDRAGPLVLDAEQLARVLGAVLGRREERVGRHVADEDELPRRRLREVADRAGRWRRLVGAAGEQRRRGERRAGQAGAVQQAAAGHRVELETVSSASSTSGWIRFIMTSFVGAGADGRHELGALTEVTPRPGSRALRSLTGGRDHRVTGHIREAINTLTAMMFAVVRRRFVYRLNIFHRRRQRSPSRHCFTASGPPTFPTIRAPGEPNVSVGKRMSAIVFAMRYCAANPEATRRRPHRQVIRGSVRGEGVPDR